MSKKNNKNQSSEDGSSEAIVQEKPKKPLESKKVTGKKVSLKKTASARRKVSSGDQKVPPKNLKNISAELENLKSQFSALEDKHKKSKSTFRKSKSKLTEKLSQTQAGLEAAQSKGEQANLALQVMDARFDELLAQKDWFEKRWLSGQRPNSHFVAALMKSGRIGRALVMLSGFYSLNIGRNPLKIARFILNSEEIRRSGLFDEKYYLEQNWDVAAGNDDPVIHYMIHGANEGRNPSLKFNTLDYLDHNPDVEASGANPFLHYIRHGQSERRVTETWGNEKRERALAKPYDARPDDDVLPEAQLGSKYMEAHALLGDSPDYASAIKDLYTEVSSHFMTAQNSVKRPDVSIVIPVYGQLSYTLNCLHSLAGHSSKYSCEIIVIDDCSPDETPQWINQIGWVRFVSRADNGGFIASCNQGASLARGKHIVFLNNDTRIVPGWLDELIGSFETFPDAGLIGSKLLYPDGSLQEAGGIIWKDGSAWNYGRNDDPNRPEYCYARQVDYVSGASIAVKSDVWKQVGGFDGDYYDRAYCEDADLAFQIRKAGYETWYQPCSRIIHYEGKTSGTDTGFGEKAYQLSNQKLFFKRWEKELSTFAENGHQPFLESDRKRNKLALIIDATTPTPDQDAGSVTVGKILNLYQKLGYRPIFVPQDNYLFQSRYSALLQRAGVCCEYAPYHKSLDSVLEVLGEDISNILVFRIGVAEKVIDMIDQYAPQAETVFHNIDLHFLRLSREASLSQNKKALKEVERVKALELDMISRVDCAIVHTDVEQEIVLLERPEANVKVFTYMVDLEGTVIPFKDRKDIMFLGGYSHAPNVDAVVYFVSEIWPLVKAELPGCRFVIVGANPPSEVTELAADDVIVTGRVEDLRPYFDSARVFVAPLRYGAGIKGKVSTTMSYGLPSVVSSIAAEGMGLIDGDHVFVRDDPEAFSRAVIDLYCDEEKWSHIQNVGFDFVDRHYSMSMGQETLADIISSAEARFTDRQKTKGL